MAKRGMTQFETLNHYTAVIKTASTHPKISTILDEHGYDSEQLSIGKQLIEATQNAYDNSKKEGIELREASDNFKFIRDIVSTKFTKHRKLAKVVFRGNVSVLNKLEIYKSVPRAYSMWLEHMIKFYDISINDIAIQNGLMRFRISITDLQEVRDSINEMVELKRKLDIEEGEKQSATQSKNESFEKLDLWMSDFEKVADIVFEDDIQMLEALGRTIS